MQKIKTIGFTVMCTVIITCFLNQAMGQTNNDAIMMNKGQFCNGLSYSYSKWTDYWEGTFKRENKNIGSLTTQSIMYMPNYGISDKLNVMASVPYVMTHASAGTLHDMNGFQDLSLDVKWKPL